MNEIDLSYLKRGLDGKFLIGKSFSFNYILVVDFRFHSFLLSATYTAEILGIVNKASLEILALMWLVSVSLLIVASTRGFVWISFLPARELNTAAIM